MGADLSSQGIFGHIAPMGSFLTVVLLALHLTPHVILNASEFVQNKRSSQRKTWIRCSAAQILLVAGIDSF